MLEPVADDRHRLVDPVLEECVDELLLVREATVDGADASGRGGELLTVAAAVAGVDAVVAKSDPPLVLLEAIREAACDGHSELAVRLRAQARAAARLDPADHAILAMRLAGNAWADIADTLQLSDSAVAERGAGIVIRLTQSRLSPEPAGTMTGWPSPIALHARAREGHERGGVGRGRPTGRVAGGGIGGLVLALGLRERGVEVEVHE